MRESSWLFINLCAVPAEITKTIEEQVNLLVEMVTTYVKVNNILKGSMKAFKDSNGNDLNQLKI